MQFIPSHFCCEPTLLLRLSSFDPVLVQQLCYELSSWSVWAKLSYTAASPLKQSHRSQLVEAHT